jgi:hypothetical protein
MLETWTVLSEHSDRVRAVVVRERSLFVVRDADGRLLGRYATVGQAFESLPAEAQVS